jgi:hypothetical protein
VATAPSSAYRNAQVGNFSGLSMSVRPSIDLVPSISCLRSVKVFELLDLAKIPHRRDRVGGGIALGLSRGRLCRDHDGNGDQQRCGSENKRRTAAGPKRGPNMIEPLGRPSRFRVKT